MSETELPETIVFSYSLICAAISAIPLLWAWQTPDATSIVMLVFIGAAATAGQFLLTRGYGMAPAAQVGPFVYTSVVFASIFGWVFWAESLDAFTIMGSALVFLSGVIAARAGNA